MLVNVLMRTIALLSPTSSLQGGDRPLYSVLRVSGEVEWTRALLSSVNRDFVFSREGAT